jgi:hypothetical protein
VHGLFLSLEWCQSDIDVKSNSINEKQKPECLDCTRHHVYQTRLGHLSLDHLINAGSRYFTVLGTTPAIYATCLRHLRLDHGSISLCRHTVHHLSMHDGSVEGLQRSNNEVVHWIFIRLAINNCHTGQQSCHLSDLYHKLSC